MLIAYRFLPTGSQDIPPLSPSVHHGKHENCSLKLLPLCWAFSDSFQHHLKQECAFPSLKKINLPWCQWLSGLHVFGLSHGIFTLIGDNVADLDHLLKDDILVRSSQTINNDLSTCIEMFYTSIQHFHKESQSSLHCSVFDFPELSTSGQYSHFTHGKMKTWRSQGTWIWDHPANLYQDGE